MDTGFDSKRSCAFGCLTVVAGPALVVAMVYLATFAQVLHDPRSWGPMSRIPLILEGEAAFAIAGVVASIPPLVGMYMLAFRKGYAPWRVVTVTLIVDIPVLIISMAVAGFGLSFLQ